MKTKESQRRYREHAFDALVILLVFLAAACMAGCTGTGGALQVRVPVPVPCQEKKPTRPIMPTEGLKPGGSIYKSTLAMQAEIERRQGYETKLEAALDACIAPLAP